MPEHQTRHWWPEVPLIAVTLVVPLQVRVWEAPGLSRLVCWIAGKKGHVGPGVLTFGYTATPFV